MTAARSVLAGLTPADVVAEPFPHVVVRDALDADLCARLIAEFPPVEVVSRGAPPGSNRRFSYPAADLLGDSRVTDAWRATVGLHVSQAFLADAVRVFGPSIRRLYPQLERELAPLETLRAGIRGRDTFETADVLLDAQPSVNTPVTAEPTSVRGGHVDNPRKLFAGLLYLRHPDDRSVGGDLELYRFRGQEWVFEGAEIADRYLERVQRIPYGTNVLVCFVNSLQSLHGVTVRARTPATRLFLNLLGEVRRPLFEIRAVSRRGVSGLLRRLVPGGRR